MEEARAMAQQLEIFVSHSHHDDAFARDLVGALRAAGANVWYDEDNLEAGRLMQIVEVELRRRPVFLVVLTPAALASQWVFDECTWAYNRLRRDPTRIILPVLAATVDEDAIWLFLQDFKRVETPGVTPFPAPEAIQRTLRALALTPPGEAPMPVRPQPGESAREILDRAKVLLAQHRYHEAVPLVEQAVALAPDSFEAWASKARVHDELNEGEPALAAADRALQLNPQNSMAWASRAGALVTLKRSTEGLTAAEAALAFDPEDAVAWHNKGNALDDLGRHKEALAAYEQAIELDPADAFAWDGKGIALNYLGRHKEALTAADRALQLDRSYTFAWGVKGNTLAYLGRHKEALAAYEQAIELDPAYAIAWNDKGAALHALRRHEEALIACERAIELNPALIIAWNNKAVVLQTMGRKAEADRALAQAKSLGG
jgi:tetratricopeptide (TPR) repeat protein